MSQPKVSFEAAELDKTPKSGQSQPQEYRRDYFSASCKEDGGAMSTTGGGKRASLSIRIPPSQPKVDVAFAALQYLPMPVLVLSSDKSIVFANESAGKLFGVDLESPDSARGEGRSRSASPSPDNTADVLYGVPISRLGLDILQGGAAQFVAWDNFLDTVVGDAESAQRVSPRPSPRPEKNEQGGTTPTDQGDKRSRSNGSTTPGLRTEVHDAVTEVVFSTNRDKYTGLPLVSRHDMSGHIQAQMIVSIWQTEDEQYFTLTFTASSDSHSSPATSSKTTSRTVSRATTVNSTSLDSGLSSTSSSNSSAPPKFHWRRSGASTTATPHTNSPKTQVTADFPPKGPPAKTDETFAPSYFSKINKLKDAILNSMDLPAYAMWRDSSFGVPNKAAIKLLWPWSNGEFDSNEQARDFLSRYILYYPDFSEQLPFEDLPILRLMREQERFEGYRVGMYSAKDGTQILFDVTGETLLDDKGEFLGGLVIFNDVTDFANTIKRQQRENEHQFESICNMVPQMIWRTDPVGSHDWFSNRWYAYTGLSVEDSCGDGWANAFHPDDLVVCEPIWKHCLATGDEYRVEYRCLNIRREYRWMLGRATPMKDEDGKIVKWFGTCTDIHDLVCAREQAKQTKSQLERVIAHARITLWAVDMDSNLSLFEGRSMLSPSDSHLPNQKDHMIGKNIYEIFREQGRQSEIDFYGKPIGDIIAGRITEQDIEVKIEENERWYRTRFFPLMKTERNGGVEGEAFLDGVVGISMDVTELKKAADQVAQRNKENGRLMAQSVAAKEASKMKSQFLANMSHEIRTPIAGVIGMSELLLDDDIGQLTKDQKECAENIQRSANGLLTVINDILDFSKVESGRLDIEEVQFDLSMVIRDVNKILSFAAERKGLKYIDDIQEMQSWKVMGDPGRLRQVITNLLTNSIKFTYEGSVTLRVKVRKETTETAEVHFTVEDTGIGIEEQVRRKLFTPFSQADSSTARRFGGTGLGLTISKNLVELMRGEISLESQLGLGTKASFSIPFSKVPYQTSNDSLVHADAIPDRLQSDMSISQGNSESSVPATPVGNSQPGFQSTSGFATPMALPTWPSDHGVVQGLTDAERKATHVLVVEDNAVNQQIALRTISKLGFSSVKAVWNGKEALEYLENPSGERPRPDVILMDVQMPILDGYRATYTIRNAQPFASKPEICSTPIVAMTASAIQGDREKCQRAGMDDYLAKPVKKQNLERMLIKWAIEGRRKRALLLRPDPYFSPASTPALERPAPVGPLAAEQPPNLDTTPPEPTLAPVTTAITSVTRSLSSPAFATASPEQKMHAQLNRLEYATNTAVARSSESSNDTSLRHQRAEEKAISLRDDQLMSSAEDPRARFGRASSRATSQRKDWSANGQQPLTTANVEKHLRSDQGSQEGGAGRLKRELRGDVSETNTEGRRRPADGGRDVAFPSPRPLS